METQSHARARVSRTFSVPPERVFDAWLNTDMIGRWMFGPAVREEEVVRLALDARIGGRFSFVVRREGEEINHTGEYLELDRPHRLVFTWSIPPDPPDSSRVIIDIVPVEGGCELTLTHELHPDWANFAASAEAAWAHMLDMLAATFGKEEGA